MKHENWTFEKVNNLFKERGYTLLETEYRDVNFPMRYIAKCGHEHKISLTNFKAGKGDRCPRCRHKLINLKESHGTDFYMKMFESAGCKVLSNEIPTNTTKVRYIALCGHENEITPAHFRQGNSGRVCRKCSKSIKYEFDYVAEAFENEGCWLLEDEYINCKTPMRYIAKCGHEGTITFDVFLNSKTTTKRCDKCGAWHGPYSNPERLADKKQIPWSKAVRERDHMTCQACGITVGEMHAHHLNSYSDNPSLRYDINNGITLCKDCHMKFHHANGFGGNTKEQFQEWLQAIPR